MSVTSCNILVLPGDHAGPEVMHEALKVFSVIQSHRASTHTFTLTTDLCGGCSIDAHKTPITDEVLQKASAADAILFGSVGGPEWGTAYPNPESGLLQLRMAILAFANLRPCKMYARGLVGRSPLKAEVVRDVDFVLVRENCGGAYFGPKVEDYEGGVGSDSWQYTRPEVERVARVAGALAVTYTQQQQQRQSVENKKTPASPPVQVTSADKANVLASSRLWRHVVTDVFAQTFPHIPLRHQLADSLSMLLCTQPSTFNGIILADNTFGDMLSDQAGGLLGTLGVLPSASLCGIPQPNTPVKGLYEPVHGSAPDIAGQGKVNPVAQILSLAMMLRYSFCLHAEASAVEDAVRVVLDDRADAGLELRTPDLGGRATTAEVGDAVCEVLRGILETSQS